jgi:hypothetical protein
MNFHWPRLTQFFSSVANIPEACESCQNRHLRIPSQQTSAVPPAARREIFAWAMFDFTNSGYTTVVFTVICNAYFVGVVAGNGADQGRSRSCAGRSSLA